MRESRPTDPTPEGVARQIAVDPGRAPVRLSKLWIGVALAPAIWVVAELAGYYLAARSCEPFAGGVPLKGTPWPATTHVIVEVVAAAIAAVGLAVSISSWRATRGDENPHAPAAIGRAHFMAFTGVAVNSIFLFGILLFAFGGLVVNACSQAR